MKKNGNNNLHNLLKRQILEALKTSVASVISLAIQLIINSGFVLLI
jgi:hypothetical protein